MRTLFIDTGAFLARAAMSDQHHQAAVDGWRAIEASRFRLVSSTHVLDESVTLIARRLSAAYAAEWAEVHLASKLITWHDAERADLDRALRLLKKLADQRVSFTDCLSFALMKRLALRWAFTFDFHFEAAGFRRWSHATSPRAMERRKRYGSTDRTRSA